MADPEQQLRDAANAAGSGPRAAELHQAADEAEAAHTDEAAVDAAASAFDRWWVGESRVGLDPTQAERALWVSVVEAVGPLIAARVRAERDTHWQRRLGDLQAEIALIQESHEHRVARVRAEERQRITADLGELPLWFEHGGELVAKAPEQVRTDAVRLAAGSAVPVATPQPVDEVACPNCEHRIRARMSDAPEVATADRPEIVVLCGSTRFKDAFREVARSEALAGRIVLTVSDLDPRPEMRHVNVPIDAETKARLDELHKRKIDLADRVLVLNVGGYIGESTRSEIDYATAHGKPITYLEPPGPVATPTEPAPPSYERPHGPHCYPWDWQYGDNEPNCEHRRPAEQDGQR